MKILIVTVTPKCSIDKLAEPIKKHNEHLLIDIFPFHAKRYSPDDLKTLKQKVEEADLIDFEYWRGAMVFKEKFPELFNSKKKIVAHHNPYDISRDDWKDFDKVVVKNESQKAELAERGIDSVCIRHSIDMNFFKFNEDYPDRKNKTVGMVAFRTEGKKGIREVVEVCKEEGYKFLLVGHISKPDYFKQLIGVGGNFEFREDIPDDELKEAYKEMDVLVCNSVDGFESGTLPILEAMGSGVPVLTRKIGLVPDLFNGENMIVRSGQTEDKEDLKNELNNLLNDYDLRKKIREKAWSSLRDYSEYRTSKEYAKLYNSILYPGQPLVSVITATYNREEQVVNIIKSLKESSYKNIEMVVCDDNSTDGTESAVKSLRESCDFPIKYVNTNSNGYNLAMARNLGLIESDGEFVMILDSRLVPDKYAIETFLKNRKKGKFCLFGNKGSDKKTFVENFCFMKRIDLVNAGMFNERITKYGGMSQELRERFSAQGIITEYVPKAKATETKSAKKMSEKRDDIIEMKDLLYKLKS